jgi:5-formyltetrahydrofolate cyclo-ligase
MTVKQELRATLRARRKQLVLDHPEAAQDLARHAAALPPGHVVALYQAIGSELKTDPLAHALIEQGRMLCLPVVIERDAPVIFRHWSPGDPLEEDVAGCPAPLTLSASVQPDLILCPLLAFDLYGQRLGQGGGYYDRTFAALPNLLRIGLAYAGQEVGQLETEPHDIGLHGVLTENGYRALHETGILR